MKVVDQFPFVFESQTFEIYWTDDKNLILPIRPICDELGLDFSGQLQHIKRDEVLAEHLFTVVASTLRADGKAQDREVACISLKRMHLWFGTINASRVRPELREKIVHFKRELGDVAWAAFRTRVLPEDILAELDASLPSPEREYYKAMDRAAALRDHVQKHGKEIDSLRSRVEQLEARLIGTDFINSQQARQYLNAVGVLGDLLKKENKKMASPYAVIHNKVKDKFKVASYQLLPEKEFPEVLKFLAQWHTQVNPGLDLPEVFSVQQERLL